MKKSMLLIISLLLLFNCRAANKKITKENFKNNQPLNSSLSIFCTSKLNNLTTKWVNNFYSQNPDLRIIVTNVTESSLFKNLNTKGNLAIISSEDYAALNEKSMWKILVGRDVVVPIINSKNPVLSTIDQEGVSAKSLAQIFLNPKMKNWGAVLQNKRDQNLPLHFYMINDESVKSRVANFLKIDQASMDGIKVKGETELVSAIQNDPHAIGFCRMTDIFDFNDQSIVKNIKLLPIDINENGRLDNFEKIYGNINDFTRGVWIGKFPRALVDNLYCVASVKPKNEKEIAFIKWIVTDGQQFVHSAGYGEIALNESQSNIDKLSENKIIYPSKVSSNSSMDNLARGRRVMLIIIGCVVAFFVVMDIIRFAKYKGEKVKNEESVFPMAFDEGSVSIPKGLYYDKTHLWAFMEKDGMVELGIGDFLQHITGPLTHVKMKNTGEKVKKGEPVLTIIQNGKQLNFNTPITGTIRTQNKELNAYASLLNSSPYQEGWVYRIEPANWLREIRFLFMSEKYKEWIHSEFVRLKEFLAISVEPKTVEYSHVLQDGGALKEGMLEDLGPEVWEDFQTNFIDTFE